MPALHFTNTPGSTTVQQIYLEDIFYILLQILIEVFFVRRRLKSGQNPPRDAFAAERFAEMGGANILQYLSRQTKKQRIAVS